MLEGAEVIAGNQELGKVVHKSLQEFHHDPIQADWTVVGDQVLLPFLNTGATLADVLSLWSEP